VDHSKANVRILRQLAILLKLSSLLYLVILDTEALTVTKGSGRPMQITTLIETAVVFSFN
jgi:hypothetical protein